MRDMFMGTFGRSTLAAAVGRSRALAVVWRPEALK